MVRSERRDATLLVTLDRPERRNAVNHEALEGLAAAFTEAASDEAVRVLVLTGAGGHFCAGADLSGVEDAGFAAVLRRVLFGLRDLPKPAIAAIDGAALGAGTQLAVACDLRVATEGASFGIPAAKLGLMVDHWTVQRLALDLGFGPARAVLVGAEVLTGADCHRLGLVQRLGSLDDALAWATHLADLAPLTMAGHKLGLARLEAQLGTDPTYQQAFRGAWGSTDLQEGVAAFREKRPPTFRGH